MAQHEEGLCEEFLEIVPTSSYLTEPPDADPHVRWCGRGAETPSPFPNFNSTYPGIGEGDGTLNDYFDTGEHGSACPIPFIDQHCCSTPDRLGIYHQRGRRTEYCSILIL